MGGVCASKDQKHKEQVDGAHHNPFQSKKKKKKRGFCASKEQMEPEHHNEDTVNPFQQNTTTTTVEVVEEVHDGGEVRMEETVVVRRVEEEHSEERRSSGQRQGEHERQGQVEEHRDVKVTERVEVVVERGNGQHMIKKSAKSVARNVERQHETVRKEEHREVRKEEHRVERKVVREVKRVERVVERVEHEVETIVDHGWSGMMHHKTYGQKHQYWHMQSDVMEHFDCAILSDLGHAEKYLNHHRRACAHQAIHLDLSRNGCDAKSLEGWCKLLEHQDHITSLKLSFYENHHLTQKHFQCFMACVAKMQHLRKLEVNLRWCDQVTDDWMKHLADVLPEHLESLELWVWKCHRVTNRGLAHLMESMNGCSKLAHVKIYAEETGCTPEHGRKLGEFHAARKFATMRMVGCGLDMNEC